MSDSNQQRADDKNRAATSRRDLLKGAGLAGLLALGSSSASAQTGVGGGPADDPLAQHRVKKYRAPMDARPSPGVAGREYEVFDPGTEHHGKVFVDDGATWHLVDRQVQTLSTERAHSNNSEADFTVYRDGGTFYATDNTDDVIDSNADLATVVSSLGAYLPATADGERVVAKGDLEADGELDLNTSNVSIEVDGRITATSAINGPIWNLRDDSDVTLTGGIYELQSNADHAVHARNGNRVRVGEMDIRDSVLASVDVSGGTVGESWFWDIRTVASGDLGLGFVTLRDSFVSGCTVGTAGSEGVYDAGENNHYTDIVAYLCASGMKLDGGQHTVKGLRGNNNTFNGLHITADDIVASNIRAFANGQGGNGGAYDAGIRMNGCQDCSLTGIRAKDDQSTQTQSYGIAGENSPDFNQYGGSVRGNRDGATTALGASSNTSSLIE